MEFLNTSRNIRWQLQQYSEGGQMTTFILPAEKSEVRMLHNEFRIWDGDRGRNAGNTLNTRVGTNDVPMHTPTPRSWRQAGIRKPCWQPPSALMERVQTPRLLGEELLFGVLQMWKSSLKCIILRSYLPKYRLEEKSKQLTLGFIILSWVKQPQNTADRWPSQ